jgi:hypothetical protein
MNMAGLDPVEIEIRLRQNVSEEAGKATGGLAGLSGEALKASRSARLAGEEMEELSRQVDAQKDFVKKLEKEYRAAEKALEGLHGWEANSTRQKEEARQKLREVGNELEKERSSLDALSSEYKKLKSASESYTTQLGKTRDEMIALHLAGQQDSDRYKELEEELEQVSRAYRVVRQEQQALSRGGAGLAGLAEGLSAASGAYSTFLGVASMVSSSNENLVKIQTKLQQAIAITVGLQQVATALHQTSAFRTRALAAVTNTWTAAQARLAVALGISTTAASALMGVLTLGLSVAITAAVVAIDRYADRQRRLAEEQEKFNEEVASGASETLVAFEKLRREWEKTGNDLKARERLLVKNIDKYRELGVEVNNVADADNLFIKNAGAFIESVKYRAKAAAAMKLASEKYEEAIKKMMEADAMPDKVVRKKRGATPTMTDLLTSANTGSTFSVEQVDNDAKARALAIAEGFRVAGDAFIDKVTGFQEEQQRALDEANIRLLDSARENTREWWERYKVLYEGIASRSVPGSEEFNAARARIEEASKALDRWKITGDDDRSGQRRLDAATRLAGKEREIERQRLLFRQEMEEKNIDLMDEGFAKELARLNLNYKKELAAIREFEQQKLEERQEIEKLAWQASGGKGTFSPATTSVEQLPGSTRRQAEAMASAAVAAWTRGLAGIQQVNRELLEEERHRFDSELEKNLFEINKYHDERVRGAARNAALIAALEKNREREIATARVDARLKEAAFEAGMLTRREKLARHRHVFEADVEKKVLELQRDAVKERLRLLEQSYTLTPTTELAREIEEARVELEEFNAELARVPERKIQEVARVFKSIAGSLGELGGDAGKLFSGIADGIDNISVALDSTASKGDKIGAAVDSVVKMITMITSAAARRSEAEREFYQNALAFASEYALALNEQLRLQGELSGGGFVNDHAGKIEAGFGALSDAAGQYNEALEKLAGGKARVDLRNAVDWNAVGKGAGLGAVAGASIGSIIPVIGTAIGAAVGALIGGIAGLFSKKKKDVTSGLLDVFPELIDASGNLNRELARSLIATNQVDDATKQLVQDALDWADAVEEARGQIEEIVVELAGDLGGSLETAIVEAWKAGEDASGRMFDAASRSLEGFVENLLYSTIFSDVFDAFRDRLVKSLDPVSGDQDILDDYDYLMREMDARDDAFVALLDAIKRRSKERGYNMWEEEDAITPSSTGIERLSQESANELNGNFHAIRQQVGDLRNFAREANLVRATMLGRLDTIIEYVAYCKHLEQINNSLEEMNTRGVNVKV